MFLLGYVAAGGGKYGAYAVDYIQSTYKEWVDVHTVYALGHEHIATRRQSTSASALLT